MRRRQPSAIKPSDATAVDSLQRGLEALRCFRPGDEMLSATEVAQRLAVPEQTALRLLITLEAARFLRRLSGGDNFSLHGECQFVGQAFLSGSALARKARPVLQNFADRFDVHVLLCLPERPNMMVLIYLHSNALKPMQLGAGFILPVADTAFGHAWLWRQGPIVQAEWLSRLRQEEPANGGNSQVAKIYQSFHDLEDGGVCITSNEWREGVSMMAMPLSLEDGSSGTIGCMQVVDRSVAVPSHAEHRIALREAAERIHDVLQRG
jgi:IclR family transcriptional regulator, positive regulator for flagellar biogenesis